MAISIKREALKGMDFGDVTTGHRLAPVHPGEVLLKDLVEPMGLTRSRVAKAMRVPQRRIDEICAGQRAITADTALRLERLFGVEAQTWMNLQAQYDLGIAERESGKRIDKEVVPLPAAAADAVRAKLAELEISEQDVSDAVAWARKSGGKTGR
jgi:addiction module HigA family antidote